MLIFPIMTSRLLTISLRLWSQYEMELFENEAACQTPLDRQYHTEVRALSKGKGRRNHRIFTYTDHDRYTSCLPFHQLVGHAASYSVNTIVQ